MPRNTIKSIRLYRGTTQQHSDYAGPVGEITVDTEKYTVVVQNGVTGGVPLAREDTVVSLTNRIAVEESVRETADTALRTSITDEVSARETADTAIQKSVTDEVSARKAADTALQKSITDEASARETADNAFQKQIDNSLRRGAVIGEVRWFAMSTPPEGWLVCNGAMVFTSNYAALFAAIGKTFTPQLTSTDPDVENPEYSDPTVFRLPNLMGKVPWGSSSQVGTEMKAGLPNINGSVLFRGANNGGLAMSEAVPNDKGAFNVSSANTIYKAAYNTIVKDSGQYLYIDASRSSSVYGNSTTVQPPALCLLPCIRYE